MLQSPIGRRLAALVIGICAGLFAMGLLVAQSSKRIKDQAEYDLFDAAAGERIPAARLMALRQWAERYPESDFKTDRMALMVQVYQQLNLLDAAYRMAQQLKALEPNNANALNYLAALPVAMNVTTPERLAEAEASAAALEAAIPRIFANPQYGQLPLRREAVERQVVETRAWVARNRAGKR